MEPAAGDASRGTHHRRHRVDDRSRAHVTGAVAPVTRRCWGQVMPTALAGQLVEVEVDIAPEGMPNFLVVGLPDAAVQEARERVRAAIRNSSLSFPMRRITVNLAMAHPRLGA